MFAVGANSGQKIQRPKTQPPLLKSQEWKQIVGSKSGAPSIHAARSTTRGVRKPPKSSLLPGPWAHAHPHPIRGTSLPPRGASKQENLLFVPIPPCCSWGPSKACAIPDVESKSPLDAWCKNISWEMSIKTGHGTVDLLGCIPKCPNLFCRR